MKIPKLTADRSLGVPIGTYTVCGQSAQTPTVRPMASLSCLSACVGPSAANRCGVLCGPDLTCWRTCAGIVDTACVAACFAK